MTASHALHFIPPGRRRGHVGIDQRFPNPVDKTNRLVCNIPIPFTPICNMAEQSDQTRNTLLCAAFAEIHRHGYQGAGITQILNKTRLTKGALYHHFPTKHALGLAVVDEVIAPRIHELILTPLQNSAYPVQTLLDITLSIGERFGEENILLGCPLNNLMQEMSPLDSEFRQHLDTILTQWRATVESALRTGQQQGVVRADVDCAAAALFTLSAWEGCIGVAKTLQSPSAFQTCMQQLHQYLRSLTTTP